MNHTVQLSPGDPSQLVPIQFPGDSLEAQDRGGLILTPIHPRGLQAQEQLKVDFVTGPPLTLRVGLTPMFLKR